MRGLAVASARTMDSLGPAGGPESMTLVSRRFAAIRLRTAGADGLVKSGHGILNLSEISDVLTQLRKRRFSPQGHTMGIDSYLVYLLISIGYIASPGPAVFIAINKGATVGVKNTSYTLFGNTTGLGIIALISALGLGAFILSSSILTNIVKLIGALWLAYIGIKMILTDASDAIKFSEESNLSLKIDKLTGFKEGLVLALTNPKPIIFFISIYPQFIVENGRENQQLILLGITFISLSFIVLNLYSFFSSMTIGKILTDRRIRIFNWIFGIIFILLSLLLLGSMQRVFLS